MALHRVSLRMAHDISWPNRRKWSNTFYVDTANPAAAAAFVAGVWTLNLRNAADSSVFAYEVHAADMVAGTDSFATVGIPLGNQRGLRVPGGGAEKYLGKACVAVTLAAVSGRPSRKFWRFGLLEGDVVAGASLAAPVQTAVTDWFNEALQELATKFLDPDGQELTGVQKVRLTTREFGEDAGNDLPEPPPVG